MNVTATDLPHKDSRLLLVTVLIVLAAALAWFMRTKLHFLLDVSQTSYSDYFWPRHTTLLPHIIGGLLAATTGLVQIWLGLSNRIGRLHRALGKFYAAGVVVGGFGGMYLALTIPDPNLGYTSGLFMLSVAWLVTTGMALYAVHNRQIPQHRDWMLRSYVVTFAFVTFRLINPWLHHTLGRPTIAAADDVDATVAWACWAAPLLLAEPLIQLRSLRRAAAVARG
jgi:uncharacterized membrane protein